MNSLQRTSESELEALGIDLDGESIGVYEMYEHDDGRIELIDTGGLSVNCRVLVIAETEAEAQSLLDACDPSASGCEDETHLYLPSMTSRHDNE